MVSGESPDKSALVGLAGLNLPGAPALFLRRSKETTFAASRRTPFAQVLLIERDFRYPIISGASPEWLDPVAEDQTSCQHGGRKVTDRMRSCYFSPASLTENQTDSKKQKRRRSDRERCCSAAQDDQNQKSRHDKKIDIPPWWIARMFSNQKSEGSCMTTALGSANKSVTLLEDEQRSDFESRSKINIERKGNVRRTLKRN